jgi:poly-gamma-glutamate synthesis protein (capsule biosynthesis protein)
MLWFSLLACSPYNGWSDAVFPYVYTPEESIEDYEEVRWETEDWDPAKDLAQSALYLLKANYHRPDAGLEQLLHHGAMRPSIPPVVEEDVTLSFVGDVMWLGGNWSGFADPVAHLLDGDLRIGNLETPTDPDGPTELGELRDISLYAFNSPPEILDGLPLDLVQLNNNHSIDLGDEGLEATLAEVEARGMLHTGVDAHTMVQIDGLNVAFLSFTWGINQRDVTSEHELFIVPFGHVDEDIDMSIVQEQIGAARSAGAHTVVTMLHWGFEYEYYPDPHFMVLARDIVGMGADVVVGSGPHVVEPAEICLVNVPAWRPGIGRCAVQTDDGVPRTAAILYSLGNFGTGHMPTLQNQVGIVATVSIRGGVTGLGWSAVASIQQDDGTTLQPLDSLLDDSDYAAEAARLDVHLGTSWKRTVE